MSYTLEFIPMLALKLPCARSRRAAALRLQQKAFGTAGAPAAADLRHITVVLRHGDRSPAFNPYEDTADASNYLAIWQDRADVPARRLSDKYPVRGGTAETLDSRAFPLQSLSCIGAAQSRFRGHQLAVAYSQHFQACLLKGSFGVRASNFTRTQRSAQHALDEMLSHLGQQNTLVPIDVRSADEDNIAVFDAANGLQAAMKAAFCGAPYIQREWAVKDIAEQLIKHIPYFHSDLGLLASLQPGDPRQQAYQLQYSKFMWIRAYDYFESSPSAPFSVPVAIRQLETSVHDHLLWRFRTLFSFPNIFKLCALSLLDEIISQCDMALMSGDLSSSIISGHDVTVLPLALALITASDEGTLTDGDDIPYDADRALAQLSWPRYSAMLVIELRVCKGNPLLCWKLYNEKLHPASPFYKSTPRDSRVNATSIESQKVQSDEIKGVVMLQGLKRFTEKIRLRKPVFRCA